MEDRNQLFGGQGRGNNNANAGRKWGVPQETAETTDLDNGGILTLQQRKMQEQDVALDMLGNSIGRTKEIALAISDEVDEHAALLDDIDGRVDKTSARVRNTTRRVDRIMKKDSSTVMWLIIVFLMISLVLLSIAAYYT